ncbi:MAG: penicillin acylase family protein [Planctomycetaceae bacterium]
MTLLDRTILSQLGAGTSIAAVCAELGIDRAEFDRRWMATIAARVPSSTGRVQTGVTTPVEIERDEQGVPHIYAENERDLFFAFGYAMAEDRLFQLDYLRRKASGRLAEILGESSHEYDILTRTVGLRRIAEREWEQLTSEVRLFVEAFTAGINAVIESSGKNLPIEFDLLDYRPEQWSPVDCIAIENEFRWYLTGRFPVIVMPELAKRALGDGPLYRDFLLAEADDESILPAGSYSRERVGIDALGPMLGAEDAKVPAELDDTRIMPAYRPRSTDRREEFPPPGGSNNWVVAGSKTASGKPMVASDPHIAFEAVSCWYEVHLSGGKFNVAGMAYVGMPAVMFGRTVNVAWGLTNNICSQRDLYQEQTSDESPGCFLYYGRWEPARELTETIAVRGREPVTKTIRFSRNGPIVSDVLPPPGNQTGPVALKWLGAHHGGWLTALIRMNAARNVAEFRDAIEPWHVPTFSAVFADVDGKIGYQAAGRLPVRKTIERGYREGWNPEHQWEGIVPFQGMPGLTAPERGWMATANNRPAPDDFPYPLAGGWISGHRAERIRHVLESPPRGGFTREHFRDLHQDAVSYHARDLVGALCDVLATVPDERIQTANRLLENWKFECDPDLVAPTLFNAFFSKWAEVVAAERFDSETAALLLNGIEAVASRLLISDKEQWFHKNDRRAKVVESFRAALDLLANRFGSDIQTWSWGKLHTLPLKHVLSSRGELGQLLDHGGVSVRGDKTTVCNTGQSPEWKAGAGANYRLIAELENNPPGLWAVDSQSQSGHPGSPHYSDQLDDWCAGRYHFIPLDTSATRAHGRKRLTLTP